jgi:hypothetical protein
MEVARLRSVVADVCKNRTLLPLDGQVSHEVRHSAVCGF